MNNKIIFLALLTAAQLLSFPITGGYANSSVVPFPGEDLVIVKGGKLKAILGVEISSMNMAAVKDGKIKAIPFQVDEQRNGKRVYDWVSPHGADKGFHASDIDKGKFDADDELTFMAWDLGPRAGETEDYGAGKVVELAITDPASKQTRYAYLLVNSKLPVSNVDYVDLKIAGGRTKVVALRYQYSQLEAAGYFDILKIKNADGGWTKNLVVRNQSPGELRVKLIGLKGEVDFSDLVIGETITRKDGPIRAMWCCKGGADFGPFKVEGNGVTEFVFGANSMNQRIVIDIPFNFDSVLSYYKLRGTLVMNPKALPAHFHHPGSGQGFKLDRLPDGAGGPLIGEKPGEWFAVSGWGACLINSISFSEKWKPQLVRSFYVDDNEQFTEAGLYLGDMAGLLSKDRHTYWFRLYFLPGDFKPGDEQKIAWIAGRKLSVEVNPLP